MANGKGATIASNLSSSSSLLHSIGPQRLPPGPEVNGNFLVSYVP